MEESNEKTLSFFLLLLITLFLSCELSRLGQETVLPNGTIISQEERQILEAMTPDFTALIAEINVQSRNEQMNGKPAGEVLLERTRELLKTRFGDDFEKYLIVGKISITETDEGSRRIEEQMNTVTPYIYKGIYWTQYAKAFWGTWGWGGTGLQRRDYLTSEAPYNQYRDCSADGVRVNYKDEYNDWQDTGLLNTAYVTMTGIKTKPGFFPRLTGETKHEISDDDAGYLYRHYSWDTN